MHLFYVFMRKTCVMLLSFLVFNFTRIQWIIDILLIENM